MKDKKAGDVHVRMPPALHALVAKEAEKNRRPINSEIVVRLEASFVVKK